MISPRMSFLIISIASNTALFVPEPNEQTWLYNFELGFGITLSPITGMREHMYSKMCFSYWTTAFSTPSPEFLLWEWETVSNPDSHPGFLSRIGSGSSASTIMIGFKTVLISLDLDFVHSASSWLESCFNSDGLSPPVSEQHYSRETQKHYGPSHLIWILGYQFKPRWRTNLPYQLAFLNWIPSVIFVGKPSI